MKKNKETVPVNTWALKRVIKNIHDLSGWVESHGGKTYIIPNTQDIEKGETNMVERTEAQGFDEFIGKVETIELEPAREEGRQDQYHIIIDPINVQVGGKTGKMHEWIRVPGTATLESVPTGSVIDAYIRSLERLNKDLKKTAKVSEAFLWMKSKSFRFSKEKLGKAYGNFPAADYWVPIELLTEEKGAK